MTSGSSDRPSSPDPFAAWNALMANMSSGTGANPAAALLSSMEATAAALAERRAQVQMLIAQLQLFDDQLAAFGSSLQPMLEWGRAWSHMQEQALDPFGLTRPKNP